MAARSWVSATLKNWSDPTGWDGGVSVPSGTDSITFTGVGTCSADSLGTWSGGNVTVSATAGIIAQDVGVNMVCGSWTQAGGEFIGDVDATFTCTAFTMTAGVFSQGGAFTATVSYSVTLPAVFYGSGAAFNVPSSGGVNLHPWIGIGLRLLRV